MTMQFLASVRRNQKQWMVVVTILSIFAFLFDDVVRGASNLTANSTALFFAVLCAGLMSIIGYPRGHTMTYGLIGFAAGGAAALIGASFAGAKPLVRTNVGNLTQTKIAQLQNRRMRINRFLQQAMYHLSPGTAGPTFGDVNESSMVAYSVLHHEAKRLGVSISDDAVAKYLQESLKAPVSQTNRKEKKLTREAYEKALKESEITEGELFDLLRDELAVQLMGRLLSPPSNTHPWMGLMTEGRLSGRLPFQTPEQLWENFRKLHVRQQLSAVAIPVSEFEKQVPEPSEAEIREFFNKYKKNVDDDRGNPGFLELPKVKLAYFAVPFSEKFEKGIPDATDQEIVDYYLAHKERDYRIFDPPESTAPKFPNVDPDAPADAGAPENTKPVLPVDPAFKGLDEKSNDPAPEKKDEKDGEKKDGDKKEAKDEEKSKNESPCGDDPQPAKDSQDAPAAKPKTDEIDLPLPPPAAGDDAPPPPALPTDDSDPFRPGVAKVRYRELDDELKQEISHKILLEKAFAKMGIVRFEAFQFLMELSLSYDRTAKTDSAKKERDKAAAAFTEKCKTYASQHGLEYVETRELNHRELSSLDIEPIGNAMKSAGDDANRRDMQTVADQMFDFNFTGRRPGLYDPLTADSPNVRYAYWKVAEVAAREPELKNDPNDLLRQRVIMEWKKDKARGLAEKRAEELKALAAAKPNDFAAALAGQTINGTKESPPVTIKETPKFTWLRVAQSFPSMGMGMGMPMESFIEGILQPGPDFMKLIFDQLGDGDVGVGLNRPRDTYYVVRVHDRDGAGADGGVELQRLHQQFLNEQFSTATPGGFGMPTPYDYLGALGVQGPLESRWRQNFNTRFGIKFEQVFDSDNTDEE